MYNPDEEKIRIMVDKAVDEALKKQRIFLHQSDIVPQTIKDRHIDWNEINTTVRAEQRVYKTVIETVNTSTTFQNDDKLKFAIKANEVWQFQMTLLSNSGATPDLKIQWTVPTGTTGYWGQDDFTQAAVAVTGTAFIVGEAADSIAGVYGVMIAGTVAGNVQLQWAQNTSDASDTSVLAGSCIIATRVK